MANIQIPNLPAVAALSGAELFEGVQAGTSVKISLDQVIAASRSGNPTTLPIPVSLGGTGVSTITGYIKGSGTTPFTGSATIPNTDITGLGTISTQNANAVAITGGSINGTAIGASDPSTIAGTTGTFTGDLTVTNANPSLSFFETGVTANRDARIRLNDNDLIFETVTDAGIQVQENMRIEYTGNVGIGTASPSALLDVAGAVNIALSSANSGLTITQTGSGNALVVEDSANPDSTPFVITTTGEVGIGVAAPTTKLDVAGAVNISVSSANNGLTITQTGAGNALVVEDSTSPDSSPFVVSATGNVGIGNGTPAAKLDVVGSTIISGDLTVDTTTLYVDAGNNRVGVGTASPSTTLDVRGNARFENDSPSIILAESDSTDTDARFRVQAGSLLFETVTDAGVLVRENMQIGSTGNVSIDTNTLFVDATNNRVGVGTTTPASALDVAGSVNLSASTTEGRSVNVGIGRTGNGTAAVDLVGDATYTSYGLRVIRDGSGANSNSNIIHRGTGTLVLNAFEAGGIEFYTTNTRGMRIGPTQAITMDNLAGSGSRAVNASPTGVLSATSDSRLKHEVEGAPIPGLAEIMQLEPRAYQWLDDIEKRGENASVEIGFFADQVKDIIPSAAPMGNDGYYGFYDRSVVAALTKAVQEQQAIIVALEARLTALEKIR